MPLRFALQCSAVHCIALHFMLILCSTRVGTIMHTHEKPTAGEPYVASTRFDVQVQIRGWEQSMKIRTVQTCGFQLVECYFIFV